MKILFNFTAITLLCSSISTPCFSANLKPNNIHPLHFRSLENEVSDIQTSVEGQIPTWLTGNLLRVGPGKFESQVQKAIHPFDGLALLTKFTFNSGKVLHSARFLQSDYYQRHKKSGKFNWSLFTQDPCKQRFWSKVAGFFTTKEIFDNANVNVGTISNNFVAMTETPLPVVFNPQTLETIGYWVDEDQINGQIATAHPHVDPITNETINCQIEFGPKCSYNFFSRNATGKRTLIASIPTKTPAYLHSFALTPNYIVLVEMPFYASMIGFITQNSPFYENYTWNKNAPSRFIVIDRAKGTIVSTLETPGFFFFHHVNAFEQNKSIMIDIICYEDPSFITDWFDKSKNLALENFHTYECYADRYTLDLGKQTITKQKISETMLELPRINDSCNTQPYSFVYAMGFERIGKDIKYQLVKINVQEGTTLSWKEDGCDPGEPVFVAAPNATFEDDGVVIATVLDTKTSSSFALVLDAKNMKELGRARIPHHIPFALHGNFYKNI